MSFLNHHITAIWPLITASGNPVQQGYIYTTPNSQQIRYGKEIKVEKCGKKKKGKGKKEARKEEEEKKKEKVKEKLGNVSENNTIEIGKKYEENLFPIFIIQAKKNSEEK